MTPTVHHGDCLEVLRSLPDASVDAVCTDPPYALSFMGKAWDSHDTPIGFQAWCQLWAVECLRVLKPGGHLLAFGGTRTWHRLACAVEDAGFEVRDSIAWMYGSGFPKSLDVSKAIDKAQGVTGAYGEPKSAAHAGWIDRGRMRGEEGEQGWQRPWMADEQAVDNAARKYVPGSPEAQQFQGWGTALKPAFEPIVVARKPLTGTVAGNVLAHGTGALNINGCRIDAADKTPFPVGTTKGATVGAVGLAGAINGDDPHPAGRWPANVILDEDQANALDQQSGDSKSSNRPRRNSAEAHNRTSSMGKTNADWTTGGHDDSGGASRFFYVAKAPKKERPIVDGTAHPTVKPLALMRWLVRLVTPPGGTVLEPFAGSGTTVEACILEGFNVIAIEREADYLPLIQSRIFRAQAAVAVEPEPDLFSELDGEAS